jgi:hypothetical protein
LRSGRLFRARRVIARKCGTSAIIWKIPNPLFPSWWHSWWNDFHWFTSSRCYIEFVQRALDITRVSRCES